MTPDIRINQQHPHILELCAAHCKIERSQSLSLALNGASDHDRAEPLCRSQAKQARAKRAIRFLDRLQRIAPWKLRLQNASQWSFYLPAVIETRSFEFSGCRLRDQHYFRTLLPLRLFCFPDRRRRIPGSDSLVEKLAHRGLPHRCRAALFHGFNQCVYNRFRLTGPVRGAVRKDCFPILLAESRRCCNQTQRHGSFFNDVPLDCSPLRPKTKRKASVANQVNQSRHTG